MQPTARLARAALACLLAAGALAHAFDLQGHRGARGLAPENTLAGFDVALAIGVSTLELDVGLTADGIPVAIHDPVLPASITRDANGRWLEAGSTPRVRSLTWEQLQAYDVGRIRPGSPYARTFAQQQPRDRTPVPRLADVFSLVQSRGADHVRFNIETKLNPHEPEGTAPPEAMVQAVLRTVREAGLTRRVTIQSFDWRALQLVQQLEPSIPTAYLTIQTARNDNVRDVAWSAGWRLADHGSVPRLVKAAGGTTWSPNGGALNAWAVKEAQALGLKVIPWTVNEVADMERFIDWGVDGLITDYPDRLRAVLQARGLPLPPAVEARP